MKINDFNLDMSKESEKDYMKLSRGDQTKVIMKLKKIYSNGTIRLIPPLKDKKLLKRIKIGNFRIVIFLKSKTDHVILMIGDRKEVYERIDRKGINRYR